jgi:hypothetical protein
MNKIPTSLYFLLLKNNKKENFKIILEPLQAVLQLSLLSISPIGTKLSIQNNLLYIQPPSWKQSIVRSYYMDNKEELYYLFNVIQRFHYFYGYLNERNDHLSELIPLITKMVEKGIDRLIQTYQSTETHSLLHTLRMYKMIIINPDVFTTTTITNEKENCIDEEQYTNKNRSRSNSSQLKRNHYYDNSDVNEYEDNDYEDNDNTNEYDENKYDDYDDKSDFENNSDFESSDENDEKKRLYKSKKQYGQKHRLIEEKFVKKDPIQINDVFIHIRDLYSEEILQIIYYTLVMIDKSSHQKQETKDAIHYNTYIQGLNMVLQNTNIQIQHWIKKNILVT